jgi:hypothetical protein
MPFWTDNQDYNTQVQDLIKFDATSVNATKMGDFLTSSIRSIIDSLPQQVLTQSALLQTAAGATTGTFNATNKKIITVFQGVSQKVSTEVPFSRIYDLINPQSIHFATASSPKYTIGNNGNLSCFPVYGSNASANRNILYIEYPTVLATDSIIARKYTYTGLATNTTNDEITLLPTGHEIEIGAELYLSGFTEATQLNNKWFTAFTPQANSSYLLEDGSATKYDITQAETSNTGQAIVYYPFPRSLDYAMILLTAVKVAQHILSRLIHDDEDVELANTMQLEITSLQGMYQEEMKRIIG